jgi:parvulin-like peptidyl-prolyl isomerase
MLRRRTAVLAGVLSLAAIAGCSGIKDALTSHVNVAARAGSRELTSSQLADLMTTGQMPPRKELAMAVASLWVNYQLLAQAAAKSDTLGDAGVAEDAMWAQVAQRKLGKLQQERLKTAPKPTPAELESAYPKGELLVVRHILISADQANMKPEQIAAAKKKADDIRKTLTPANFVAAVKQHSGDPGSKETGGEYLWPTPQIPQMVPEFEKASRELAPGAISDPVQTQFGFHIIYREPYAEAKAKFDSAYAGIAAARAESVWIAGMEERSKVKVKDGIGPLVKSIAENVDAHRTNRTVIVSSSVTDLRASRVAHWIAAYPPQMRVRQQISQAPDSIIPLFAKTLMRNELLLRAADSAKLTLEPAEMDQIRGAFRSSVQNTMGALGLLPRQLTDSAAAGADKATVAQTRIDSYFERLIKNQAQFVDISEPVAIALRKKYEGSVTEAGIERAVTLATEAKAKADSAAAATMPPSAVPNPGAPPQAAPPVAAPPATKKTP